MIKEFKCQREMMTCHPPVFKLGVRRISEIHSGMELFPGLFFWKEGKERSTRLILGIFRGKKVLEKRENF